MRIGIFDSGIGGVIVASELQKAFPDALIMVENDHDNAPYGDKSASDIIALTDAAIQPLLRADCDVIILACNTATTVAIDTLRLRHPSQRFIGLEPMVKPAPMLSKSGVIAICATPATLASERYNQAKHLHAADVTVVEPDCSDWATLIENNEINRKHIEVVAQFCLNHNADVVVLGCTHYHWIKDEITEALGGKAQVLEPTDAIVTRVKELLHL